MFNRSGTATKYKNYSVLGGYYKGDYESH